MSAIIAPILTEKSAQGMDSGLYVLKVNLDASKKEIMAELKKNFDIDVISCRIVNLPSKKVNFKRRPGIRGQIKKAYVQLKKGQKLPGFELPKTKEEPVAKEEKIKEKK